jgi:hypothetical protein
VTAEAPAPRDLVESVLELRDQVIGVQAQLDEIHARLQLLEERGGRRGARPRLARVRSGVRRLRPSSRRGEPPTST